MIWSTSSEGPHGADKVFRKQPLNPLLLESLDPLPQIKKRHGIPYLLNYIRSILLRRNLFFLPAVPEGQFVFF